ncbi:bifunctional 3-(3-hydroxy-phenyl)propionate/3-hydroxycinnamic acid hydroxylase [Rhodococcus fascians]|nr:bifunctional 3-(3-hydroxy-phenyl)propionate/3-hydroxycinnamic acid hydroxylase [Rhodococcus fascians]MBY4237872.1 bifunctional 3-(3-hydroxy-phenyl)propionate/3-hydroxycinnamic acid hydroxylase [Rhodococcus fascians]MBY4253377.1 bifunctional 3-(3-hydroxy-phenyl)propionate/3-hydroxycinnamic acid hydroxylase [Rhodococcus fascians]MBY4269014.1 bifunctional 3-(3-hydroxy-phenyl)propionate/3-hydroxycinnamic acid hydroxylase [Rhodococcus fascians]MBY4275067.1 bifunctional 3-(3-hydroxy-phenyl)propion
MDSTDKPYDVAIIGYGPTGVTAANLLGARGLRVLVVERDSDIYTRARAISTDEEVVRIWQHAGLADQLNAEMLPGKPVKFVDANGDAFVEVTPQPRGSGHPPQQFIYQPAVEKTLRRGVERFPNVELALQHECLRVASDSDGVNLMLADLETDTFRRARASYVIAADGGSSPTRGLLGIGFEGQTYEDRWVVIDTKVVQEWPGHDSLRFHCDPAQPTVDCPTPLGHHRWEYPVPTGSDEAKLVTDTAIWSILNKQGITDQQVEILRAVVYSHHVRFADRWKVGRIFLAGDAAHVMPPWIGQGMSAGVRDAGNLCWKLAGVIDGSLPVSVLDSYQTERMPHVREVTKRAVKTGKIITERRPALAVARNHGLRTLTKLPTVSNWLRDSRWIPPAYYPGGFFGARPRPRLGHRAGRSAVGHQIPQPWVFDEDGHRQRLDDALADRWVLLSLDTVGPHHPWISAGIRSMRVLPAGSVRAEGAVVDTENALIDWMAAKGAAAIVVRPDGFVYAAGGPTSVLASPPPGLHLSARYERADTPTSLSTPGGLT